MTDLDRPVLRTGSGAHLRWRTTARGGGWRWMSTASRAARPTTSGRPPPPGDSPRRQADDLATSQAPPLGWPTLEAGAAYTWCCMLAHLASMSVRCLEAKPLARQDQAHGAMHGEGSGAGSVARHCKENSSCRRTSFTGSHAVPSDEDEEASGDALWDDEQAAKARSCSKISKPDWGALCLHVSKTVVSPHLARGLSSRNHAGHFVTLLA